MPIKDRTSIDERPPEADGTRRGDREMDLIVGADNRMAMITLVECSIEFIMIRKLKKGKDTKGVSQTVHLMLLPYKHDNHR